LKVAQKAETPAEVVNRNLWRALLGESVLSEPLPQEIDAVRVQDIRGWRDAVLRPENGTLVIVGPDAEVALSQAEDELGSWRRSAARKPTVAPPSIQPSLGGGLRLALSPRPDLSQTVLRFGCRLPPHDVATLGAEDVLAHRVETALEWRLRERVGASYYLNAGVERLRGGLSVLWLSTAVGNSRLSEAVESLLGWLEQPELILDEGALENSRYNVLTGFALSASTTPAMAQNVFEYVRLGFPLAEMAGYPERVAGVSTEGVQRLIRACRKDAVLAAAGDHNGVESAAARFVAVLR
jgi:predicted Zn-dependent peptidase